MAADGALLSRAERLTEAGRGASSVLETLQTIIRDLVKPGGADAIGVACAGQIDPATGTVVYAPNLGWRDVPLAEALVSAFGLPVTVENDVRAAAWGEFTSGTGRDVRSLVAIFVGTGVGSGAVLDGALWRGAGNAAGEVGHTQVVPDGLPCVCGQRGCLEQYAAGHGLQRRLRDALARDVPTALRGMTGGDPGRLTATMVVAAAADGDDLAAALWSDATRYLTLGAANYVTLLNPAALVLGGGVIETVPRLFDDVADGVMRLTTVLARRSLRIERAGLGAWSGVVGAGALARPRR